jgi:hypothetical protein
VVKKSPEKVPHGLFSGTDAPSSQPRNNNQEEKGDRAATEENFPEAMRNRKNRLCDMLEYEHSLIDKRGIST